MRRQHSKGGVIEHDVTILEKGLGNIRCEVLFIMYDIMPKCAYLISFCGIGLEFSKYLLGTKFIIFTWEYHQHLRQLSEDM